MHWVFTAAGTDLLVAARSDKLDELREALPKIFELLDALMRIGRPSASGL